MILLFALMFGIGWFLWAPGYGERKAMALTNAVRNTGVSLVIVAGGFANTPAVPAVVVLVTVQIGYNLLNTSNQFEFGAVIT
jgi:hypothetical protein